MSKFEQNNNREIEPPENFDELKQSLQIGIHDLYFQRLLSQEEALDLLKKSAEAKNIDELHEVEKNMTAMLFLFIKKGRWWTNL